MSKLSVKTAIARAVIDPEFRKQFASLSSTPAERKEIAAKYGYNITLLESEKIQLKADCLTKEIVNMENFEELWKINESKNLEKLSNYVSNGKDDLSKMEPNNQVFFGG